MFQIPFLHKKVCEESVSNAPEVGLSIPFNTMASNHYEQPDVDFSSFSLIKKKLKRKKSVPLYNICQMESFYPHDLTHSWNPRKKHKQTKKRDRLKKKGCLSFSKSFKIAF